MIGHLNQHNLLDPYILSSNQYWLLYLHKTQHIGNMDNLVDQNEDLREQLKHQEEIIDNLIEMKNILKTQVTIENEVLKQNLKKETFKTNNSFEKFDEDEEYCEKWERTGIVDYDI